VDDEYVSYERADGVGRPVRLGLPDEQSKIIIRTLIEPGRATCHAIGVEQKEANYQQHGPHGILRSILAISNQQSAVSREILGLIADR
jgi:hypothetical protein